MRRAAAPPAENIEYLKAVLGEAIDKVLPRSIDKASEQKP